jgi:hypothetical protein
MGTRLAAGALMAALFLALGRSGAALAENRLDPCSLLRRTEVTRLTTWQVQSIRRKRYNLAGATGTMCFFEANQGTVIVMVPDHGYPFPGDSPFTDPQAQGVVRRDPTTRVEVTYYNGTIYMNVRHHDISVRLVPASHIASFFEVEPFAGVVIPRVHS